MPSMRLQLYKIISKKRAASKSHIERLTEAVFEVLRLKKKKKEAKRKQKKRAVDNEKNIVSFYHLVLSFF